MPEVEPGACDVSETTPRRPKAGPTVDSGTTSLRDSGREAPMVGSFRRTPPILLASLGPVSDGADAEVGSGGGVVGFLVAGTDVFIIGLEAGGGAADSGPAGRTAWMRRIAGAREAGFRELVCCIT